MYDFENQTFSYFLHWKFKEFGKGVCICNYFFCRESLPIYNFEQEIIQAIDQHKVTIISGETGSGLFANFFGICLHFLICIHTLSTICLQFFHRKNNSSPTIFT